MSVELGHEEPVVRVGAILIASFIGFLAGQLVAVALETLGAIAFHLRGGVGAVGALSAPPWWANALGLAGLWVGFVGAIAYAYGPGGLRPLPRQWRLRVSDVAYVALGVAAQFAVDLAYRPFHLRHLERPVHHLFDGSRGITFLVVGGMTTLLAPLFEEWLFRGVLFRALDEGDSAIAPRRRRVVAVVLSATFFAAAHGEATQFVGLFALGVLLAYLVARTRRLTPSILTHVSFNAVALVGVVAQRAGH